MALLPARNILDGTALPVTSQMKTALGSLRDYLAGLLGTDSTNTAAARAALGAATSGPLASSGITGAATSGANSNITSLTGLTTPLSMAQGGTGMANGFVSSLLGDGYQKLPSGLILQWGSVATNVAANTGCTWTMPISNPNATLVVLAVHSNDGARTEKVMINVYLTGANYAYYNLSASGSQITRFLSIGY